MDYAENTELIDDFEQFYRRYYSDEIGIRGLSDVPKNDRESDEDDNSE